MEGWMLVALGAIAGAAATYGVLTGLGRRGGRAQGAQEGRPPKRPPAISVALPASASGMVIEASGTDSTLADGTGITGARRTGATALVRPDTTLVSFRDSGKAGAEPRLEAWHVGARGAVRPAHFGAKPPAEMRAWLDKWLGLGPHDRLARLHDQVARAQQSAEVAAEKEPDWDKAAELQGEANALEGTRLEIEAERKAAG